MISTHKTSYLLFLCYFMLVFTINPSPICYLKDLNKNLRKSMPKNIKLSRKICGKNSTRKTYVKEKNNIKLKPTCMKHSKYIKSTNIPELHKNLEIESKKITFLHSLIHNKTQNNTFCPQRHIFCDICRNIYEIENFYKIIDKSISFRSRCPYCHHLICTKGKKNNSQKKCIKQYNQCIPQINTVHDICTSSQTNRQGIKHTGLPCDTKVTPAQIKCITDIMAANIPLLQKCIQDRFNKAIIEITEAMMQIIEENLQKLKSDLAAANNEIYSQISSALKDPGNLSLPKFIYPSIISFNNIILDEEALVKSISCILTVVLADIQSFLIAAANNEIDILINRQCNVCAGRCCCYFY